jgi:hypothetical protein
LHEKYCCKKNMYLKQIVTKCAIVMCMNVELFTRKLVL